MLGTTQLGAVLYTFERPATAADALEWTVFIYSRLGFDMAEFLEMAHQWIASRLVSATDVETGAVVPQPILSMLHSRGDDGLPDRLAELSALGTTIAKSSGLPQPVIDGLAELWDRQLDVPKDFRHSSCDCPRCTGENPEAPDDACKLAGIDQRIIELASQTAGIDEGAAILSAPPWALDICRLRSRAKSRSYAAAEKKREDVKETEAIYDRVMPSWREKTH